MTVRGPTGDRESPQLSDRELMRRVRDSHDREAFGWLYDRHAARGYRLARWLCSDDERSQAAVRDGFLTIWRCRDWLDPGGSFLASSLISIRHAALAESEAESGTRRDRHAVTDRAAADAQPVPARAGPEGLRSSLEELSVDQAEVVELAYFGGLTPAEIATALDLPAAVVKGRMRLGLDRLRRGHTLR